MNDFYLIALAALLHDIGKFCQRANYYTTWDKKNLENIYKYQHAYFTYQYLTELQEILKESLNLTELEFNELKEISARHHNPIPNNIKSYILTLADNLSSTERERFQQSDINLLHSIFERISFLANSINPPYFHKITKLSLLENDIFPVKDIDKLYANHNIISQQYRNLFLEFNNEMKNIQNFKGVKSFNYLYYLLAKYLWSVPSATYDIQNRSRHYSDISLFDHSKVVAMLSVSLLDYYYQIKNNSSSNGNLEVLNYSKMIDDTENVFLIVEGNIGGIQNFIYNIAKTPAIEDFSISKSLRGRSLLVALLTELVSRNLLKELNYPITNILYIGGGKFQIIIANTPKNIEILNNIENLLNKYLCDEFHMELRIIMTYQEFSINTLKGISQNFSDIVQKLQINIDKAKKQLFKNYLTVDFKDDQKDICKSCKSLPIYSKDLCKLCELSNSIGEETIYMKYISFDLNKKLKIGENKYDYMSIIDLDDWGNIYFVIDMNNQKSERIRENSILNELEEVLYINNLEFGMDNISNGFKFIASTVPLLDKDIRDYVLSNFDLLPEQQKELKQMNLKDSKKIMSFGILSEFSIGDKKLAALRADIDNLGLIFSDGLRSKDSSQDSDKYTFSRIAALSRMLELFFSGYINTLIKQESKKYMQSYNNLELDLIYTVYSGGDDLFLIGPYNFILDFSLKLREKLHLYVSENYDFGLSAGIFIFKSNLPVNKVAKYSKNQEEFSKQAVFSVNYNNKAFLIYKDSISIFNKTYKWINSLNYISSFNILMNELNIQQVQKFKNYITFENILDISKELAEYINNNLISRSLVYRILEYYKLYIKDDKINPLIYPKIYYQMARNIKNKEVKEKLEELLLKKGYKELSKEEILTNLDTILYITLMLTRN